MQLAQDGAAFRDQQTAARVAIKSMHELEFFELGMDRTQRFDDTVSSVRCHHERQRLPAY